MSKQLQTSTGGVLRDEHRVKDENGNWVTAVRLEAARTNSILHSEDFSETEWSGSASVTTDDAVAPDGTQTADFVEDTDSNSAQNRQQSVSVSDDSLARTASVFIKKASSTPVVRISANYNGGSTTVNPLVYFDPETGNTDDDGDADRIIVEDYNSDWWRVSVTVSNNSTGNTTFELWLIIAARAPGDLGIGDQESVTGGNHVWGAQVEGVSGGASFPSSYIATTDSAVSRAADSLTFPIGFGPQELTIYGKLIVQGTHTDNLGHYLHIGANNSTATHLTLFTNSTANGPTLRYDGQGGQADSFVNPTPSFGDVMEYAGQLHSDGSVQLFVSYNGGTVTDGGRSSAIGIDDSWNEDTIGVASHAAGVGDFGHSYITGPLIAPGVRTMDEMRRLAGN